MKPSKTLIIVLKGSKRIRQMAADSVCVKVKTFERWMREETDDLLDVRIHETVAKETGLDKESLVDLQSTEKVA
jgi:hypothetical protein